MPASTGSEVLDDGLRGGFPTSRTVLVTGGPGTGKTTLAVQFLQAGLDAGERCLFVSTEQTPGELRDAFSAFAFDLEHDDLSIASIHATTGHTLEDDEAVLTLQSLGGEESLEAGYSAPFEPAHVVEHLERLGPADRVVLDSVSGLSAMDEDRSRFRRTVLDLIRLFTDDFGATAMLTAEETDGGTRGGTAEAVQSVGVEDAVQFNTHGVVRVWRERVAGDLHRFPEVVKMRGVDHDDRVYEVDFSEAGLHTYPRLRSHPTAFVPDDYLTTGVPGLDALLGGGICLGGTTLPEHDGLADPHSLLTSLVTVALDREMSVVLVPPVELPPDRLATVLPDHADPLEELLATDRPFLIDFADAHGSARRNVFAPGVAGADPVETFETVSERRGERDLLGLVNVEAQLPALDADDLRRLRSREDRHLFRSDDTAVYVLNPETLPDRVAAFHRNAAWQVLRMWVAETGLQYVKLRKAPDGYVGTTSLVEYAREPPHLRVQRPPMADEAAGGR